MAVINNMIVGIENRDGNANVRFHQQMDFESKLALSIFLADFRGYSSVLAFGHFPEIR